MKKEYSLAIIISMAIHVAIIIVIVFFNISSEVPLGDGIVSVEIVPDSDSKSLSLSRRTVSKIAVRGEPVEPRTCDSSNDHCSSFDKLRTNGHLPTSETVSTSGESNGITTSGNYGSPSGNPILTEIRNKIERAKYYPPIAKQRGEEGKPLVSFQINPDGSLAHVKVTRTSGNKMLDDAAVDTIKRAVPYPFYSDEISLAIKFSLE